MPTIYRNKKRYAGGGGGGSGTSDYDLLENKPITADPSGNVTVNPLYQDFFNSLGGVNISEETGNAIVEKDDGLYVPTVTGMKISQEAGNIIEEKDDGLYATSSDISISQEEGNIIEEKDDGLYAYVQPGTIVEANVEITEDTNALTSIKVGDTAYSITKAIANYIDENFTNANVEGF